MPLCITQGGSLRSTFSVKEDEGFASTPVFLNVKDPQPGHPQHSFLSPAHAKKCAEPKRTARGSAALRRGSTEPRTLGEEASLEQGLQNPAVLRGDWGVVRDALGTLGDARGWLALGAAAPSPPGPPLGKAGSYTIVPSSCPRNKHKIHKIIPSPKATD